MTVTVGDLENVGFAGRPLSGRRLQVHSCNDKVPLMKLPEEITRSNPSIDNRLPTPGVIESTDDIINLDVPFTVELPPVDTNIYSHVILMFVNADGSDSPQALTLLTAVAGQASTYVVDNNTLSPPFDRDQTAVVRAYLRIKEGTEWHRTPDSVIYAF